ncbi:MAG: hypothetical protein AAGI91_11420 [Bacteroidota bacterium]
MTRPTSALLLAAAAFALALPALAQDREDLPAFLFDPSFYGNRTFEKSAEMDGNEVALTFFNYGLLGGTGEIRGNWPKGSQNFYIGDVLPVVAVEVPVDSDGDGQPDQLQVNTVTTRGPRAGADGPPGQSSIFWGFEAKPGFASDRFIDDEGEVQANDRPALSTSPETWPDQWPDQPTWINPSTGEADWNGFFGRNQFNADLETYFWMDDNNDEEITNEQGFGFGSFVADSLRPQRGGLGLEMEVRGLQWSQFLAEDAIFWLYEVTNTSTTTYPRVAVGLTVGTLAGGDGDSQDDLAFFDQANRIVYSWDNDNSGNENQEVGYVGYGFLESPGDANNGIDDDGDGDPLTALGLDIDGVPFIPLSLAGQGNVFDQSDFQPRTLAEGDPLILIDDQTGARSVVYLGAGETTVVSQGRSYTVRPGDTILEPQTTIQGQTVGSEVVITEKNLVDDDLDGIIDEDVNLHFERRAQNLQGEIEFLPALRFADYVGFARATENRTPTSADSAAFGLLNPLLDERRDDGVDNDGDWDANSDDVGADGQAGTGDAGEGDGVPSPGEPNFDALDVTESDQVGLSSFFYFNPPGAIRMNDDQRIWEAMSPGFFTSNEELAQQQGAGGVDGDFIFSSGYFRLEPGQTLRFSLATVFGNDLEDITNNTQTIQEIYDRNYQFARPPDRCNLSAVPGDGQVTLFWDSTPEASIDPILGMDFEGYRIFKSTDPFFNDPTRLTDVFGNPTGIRVADFQYDLDNGINGAFISSDPRVRGVPFPLGEDTGLQYSVVDEDVNNGQRYYYACTAYDRGSPDFYPAENNFAVSVRETGEVVTGQNVVEVVPNAPVAGYQEGRIEGDVDMTAGSATGEVRAEILDPRMADVGRSYRLTFKSADGGPVADSFFVETGGDTVAEAPVDDELATVFDGIRFLFDNDETQIFRDTTANAPANDTDTGFLSTSQNGLLSMFTSRINIDNPFPREWRYQGSLAPYDYEIRFSDDFIGQSEGGFALGSGSSAPMAIAKETNFTVENVTLGETAEFVFLENSAATRNGIFDAYEFIFIYEDLDGDPTTPTEPTYIVRPSNTTADGSFPGAGDVFKLATLKPFSPRDKFTFSTTASSVDDDAADAQLDQIRVVPNPYVAAASWERPLPQTINSGRGERRVDFINLPRDARVRVYNVRGALIWEGRHESGIDDGTLSWNLRSRENLDVAYGVYFYHVEAPNVGTKTGKLALIK